MENNEIIESMKLEMQEKEREFNEILEKTKLLDENYLDQRKQLDDAREQVRGAYTALYMQLQKFSKVSESNIENMQTENDIKTIDEDLSSKSKTTKSVKKQSAKEKVVTNLTPDEIEKLNKVVPQKEITDDKGNIIPDYLQTEYKK